MWNFLWRLGIHPRDCRAEQLPEPDRAILWATIEDQATPDLGRLREWVARGGYVVAAGNPRFWASVFDWDPEVWSTARPENPYAALAWVIEGRAPELVAPPRWGFASGRAGRGARAVGALAAVHGERQTPSRATLVPLADAPALVAGSSYCFVNGNPFAAFQAWIQGQEDLQPWLGWRHRLFWLDEWVSAIADILGGTAALPPQLPRPGIAGLSATTVVLRHDTDHSRDLSYLQEEHARSIPATHAVLRDNNTGFWMETLRRHPSHESAFHYATGGRDWLRQGRARPRSRLVSGDGLLRQVRSARTRGIGIATLHRHLAFLLYPEWVDAMHNVFEQEPRVLGGSSLFRAAVLRWGIDRVDGTDGTVGEWPDTQFPVWLPFKLAHAALGGRRLRGWESTSVMESEPELVDQMLSHRTPHLPQRVITLGYHPAHAAGTTFYRDGTLRAFTRVLDVLTDHNAQIETLGRVFTLADATLSRN